MSCHSTTKSGSRILEKIHKIWMMMMIAAGLMWAGAEEKREQFEMALMKLTKMVQTNLIGSE